jgi:hypothetical protein
MGCVDFQMKDVDDGARTGRVGRMLNVLDNLD